MAAAAAAGPSGSLKLLIDKTAGKVVFAEVEKPFVDFLFHLMSLPLGTVIKLVTQKSMVGALGNLYGSIAEISDTYLQPGTEKDVFLNPKVQILSREVPLLLPAAEGDSDTKKLYLCSGISGNHCRYFTSYSHDPTAKCPSCGRSMSFEMALFAPEKVAGSSSSGGEGGGFVRGVLSYMVMDDLRVMPQSTICAITTLNECKVKDFGSLDVKVVQFEADVGLKLLKAALQTDAVLTTVFLGKSVEGKIEIGGD